MLPLKKERGMIAIFTAIGIIEARKMLTTIIDRVTNEYGVITIGNMRNNEKKYSSIISTDILKELILDKFNFKLTYSKIDEKSELVLHDFNITVTGSTYDEVLKIASQELDTYVNNYMDNSDFNLRNPETRHLIPLVLKVHFCKNENELISLLNSNIEGGL